MKLFTCLFMLLVPSIVLCTPDCLDMPAMQNFDFNLFHGVWNTLSASMVARGTKCIQHIFQESNQNSTISIKFADKNGADYITDSYGGPIWKTETSGKLEFAMPDQFPQRDASFPYWVLDTDYLNYAVTYTCWRYSPSSRNYIAVLGRSTHLSTDARNAVNATLERINMVPDQLVQVSHTNCPTGDAISL